MNHGFPYTSTGGFLGMAIESLDDTTIAEKPFKRFAVAGIAWDGCVTNRPGARFGPNAIRQASHMLCGGEHPLFDTTPINDSVDLGWAALSTKSRTWCARRWRRCWAMCWRCFRWWC